MPPQSFLAIPNRDANATQRGFLYQAVLTVKAWAELKTDEVLELEAGEDIDWVSLPKALSRPDIDRILGQVKLRARKLSLCSPETLESIVHYWQHLDKNRGHKLLFRFISNAGSAVERGSKHPSGLPGIDIWNALSDLPPAGVGDDRLLHIRSILKSATKPSATKSSVWLEFANFVHRSSDEQMARFIQGFRWMTGSTDLEGAIAETVAGLKTRPELADFPNASDSCLESLLFQTLQTLSLPARKILTPDGCHLALLASIEKSMVVTNSGFEGMAKRIGESTSLLEAAVAAVQKLSQSALTQLTGESLPPQSSVGFGRPNVHLDRPSLSGPMALRADLQVAIGRAFKAGKGAALLGEMGTGKTQLARLVVEKYSSICWVSFGMNKTLDPSFVLEAALSKASGASFQGGTTFDGSAALTKSSVLVLDDFELVCTDTAVLGRLALIAKTSKQHGIDILLATTGLLPSMLQDSFARVAVGGYTDDDVQQLIKSYEAPSSFNNEGMRALILAVTSAHPLLVTAVLRFLVEKEWKVADATLISLFDQTFARDLRQEMQTRLIGSEAPETRELLYRLSLLNFQFTEDQALHIAAIKPGISFPNEKLVRLLGVWIQRTSESALTVSPLVSHLGRINLESKLKQKVHASAASWILKKEKTLDQNDAAQAIYHLMGAEQYNYAGLILLQILQSAIALETVPDFAPLLIYWIDQPLPSEMDASIRMVIRGVQIALCAKRGTDFEYLFADLKASVSRANDNIGYIGAVAALSYVAIHAVMSAPVAALEAAMLAIAVEPRVNAETRAELRNEMTLAEVLWLIGPKFHEIEGIRTWLEQVATMDSETRQSFLRAKSATEASWAIFQRLWVDEQRLPEKEQRWGRLLAFFIECEEVSWKVGLPLIAAAAFRAQQAVRIVHNRRPDKAVEMAKAFMVKLDNEPVGKLLVCDGTGLWLTDIDRWDLALDWLERAAECKTQELPRFRLKNFLRLAEARHRVGQDAQALLLDACAIARDSEELSDLDLIIALGELGTWLWMTNDRPGSFAVWEEVVALLLAEPEHTIRWKHLFALVANHMSFYRSSAIDEDPIGPTTTPSMGLFLRDGVDISGFYSDGTQWGLPAMMCWIAESLGEHEKAGEWALRASEIAEMISQDPRGKFVLISAVPILLRKGDYGGAVDYALSSAMTSTQRHRVVASEEMRASNPEIARIEAEQEIASTETAESWAIITGVLPPFLDMIATSVIDEQKALAAAETLIQKCDQVSKTSVNQQLWQAARDAIAKVVSGNINWHSELSTPVSNAQGAALISELFISLGAGFSNRCFPKDVYFAQMRWREYLWSYFPPHRGLHRFVAEKIGEFWQRIVQKNPFYFRRPTEITHLLLAANSGKRLGPVLMIVAGGLGVNLPDALREWLREKQ